MVERGNLIRSQRNAKLQAQRLLRRRGVVHQIAHLIQIGADAVQVAVAGLVEQHVGDIAGIERRIAQEAVIVVRVQVEAAQHI